MYESSGKPQNEHANSMPNPRSQTNYHIELELSAGNRSTPNYHITARRSTSLPANRLYAAARKRIASQPNPKQQGLRRTRTGKLKRNISEKDRDSTYLERMGLGSLASLRSGGEFHEGDDEGDLGIGWMRKRGGRVPPS